MSKIIKLTRIDIFSILDKNKNNLKAKYKVLESCAILESWYEKNEVITFMKKNYKEIESELEHFQSETDKAFQALVAE